MAISELTAVARVASREDPEVAAMNRIPMRFTQERSPCSAAARQPAPKGYWSPSAKLLV